MRLSPLDSKNQCKHGRKQLTLPRMELLAVVIGVQVINFVTSELKLLIAKRMLLLILDVFYTGLKQLNSFQCLYTIGQMKFERKKRILYIFGYVSSVLNPADFATRGLSALEISRCKLWQRGPDWLQYDESKWPTHIKLIGYYIREIRA